MSKSVKNEWFESWFDSPYYHLLYNNRDHSEAENYITKLLGYLNLSKESTLLDLGCGKGRHSFHLHKNGYKVHGIDLSHESIIYANNEYGTKDLDFSQGDMRESFGKKKYDCVLNLFTSFGYFEDDSENNKVIHNVKEALKPKAIFVQDFLNAQWVRNTLKENETQERGDIAFKISRRIENGFVKKQIQFDVEEKSYSFQEEVRLLETEDFKQLYDENELELLNIFGSYDLKEFDAQKSNRLILISQSK